MLKVKLTLRQLNIFVSAHTHTVDRSDRMQHNHEMDIFKEDVPPFSPDQPPPCRGMSTQTHWTVVIAF